VTQGTKPQDVTFEDRVTGRRIAVEVVFSHRDDARDVKVYATVRPAEMEGVPVRAVLDRYKLHIGCLPGRSEVWIT
jgi:hypothetical protein